MSEATNKEAPKSFNVDEALNTKGFAEFLAKHPDARNSIDMANEKDLESKFETFSMLGIVKKEMKDLYKNQIQEELGIKLDNSDLASIDDEIEKRAIENPEKVEALHEQLKGAKELTQQIKDLEEALAVIGDISQHPIRLENLKGQKESLDAVKGATGPLAKARLWAKVGAWTAVGAFDQTGAAFTNVLANESKIKSLKNLEAAHGKIDKAKIESISKPVEDKISEIETTLATAQNLQETKAKAVESLGELRKELLGEFSGFAEVVSIIQAKAKKMLEDMAKQGTISGFDNAQKTYEKFQKVANESDTKINPLEGMDEEEFQKMVDEGIKRAVEGEIIEAVDKAETKGNNPFSKLEKSLEGYINKQKIGSMEADEARQFVIESLEKSKEYLENTVQDNAKFLMINRILIKIKQK